MRDRYRSKACGPVAAIALNRARATISANTSCVQRYVGRVDRRAARKQAGKAALAITAASACARGAIAARSTNACAGNGEAVEIGRTVDDVAENWSTAGRAGLTATANAFAPRAAIDTIAAIAAGGSE